MIRTLIYNLGLAFGLLKMMFSAPKCKKLEKEDPAAHDDLANRLVNGWGKACIKRSGAKMEVSGLENVPKDRAVLFVANHQSNFDILVLCGLLDCNKGFVAKKELKKVPLLSFWMKETHCLFLDRENMKQSMQVIVQAYEQLKNGYSMIIFPEGTRSKGKLVQEFKAGSFKPAIKAKVPVVPITIDGTYRVSDGTGDNKIHPADVNIVIHPMIETADLSKDEIKELPAKVRDIIVGSMKYTEVK